MTPLDYKLHYRKNLPHIQPPGAMLFVTFRLAGSLPAHVVQQLQEEAEQAERAIAAHTPLEDQAEALYRERRRAFGRFDAALDRADSGPLWLSRPKIAGLVMESLHHLDGWIVELDVYCIMSNHVHVVFAPLPAGDSYFALSRIIHSLKRHTAREGNNLLQRTGQFWQHESYDHVVRDEPELDRIRRYILNNPVKAGLVDDPQAWPYSWACWW